MTNIPQISTMHGPIVSKSGSHWFIRLGAGTVKAVRRQVSTASEKPLTDEEIIINALCSKIEHDAKK